VPTDWPEECSVIAYPIPAGWVWGERLGADAFEQMAQEVASQEVVDLSAYQPIPPVPGEGSTSADHEAFREAMPRFDATRGFSVAQLSQYYTSGAATPTG
jgi:hypothetical protein